MCKTKISVLLFKLLLINLSLLVSPVAQSELTIEITKGVESAIPIAVVPFKDTSTLQNGTHQISSIIEHDLNRSGLFKSLSHDDMLTRPSSSDKIRFRNWQALGQDYLLIGNITPVDPTHFQVQFQLFGVFKKEQILGYRLTITKNELRRTAHHISDLVYEKLTGKKGVFNSRLAYITSTNISAKRKKYQLLIADADGYSPRVIASSWQPLMSPVWSPDGKQIAYVSFENKRSAIFIQTLATGKRKRVAAFKGINGAPAFSPDGQQLAFTLSKDGSPDIYIIDINNTRSLRKLTRSFGIETEPSWSPDGKNIIYTSDRGGKPQIYSISSRGGRSKRLTFEGDYNAKGSFSPDGKSIAMVHANHGDYRIAVMDLATRTMNVLTAGKYDESPSFSPNGEMILFASRKSGKHVLSAVSVDGNMQQNLAFNKGDVREPSWSP